MSPDYLVKIAQILHLFHLFTCIVYQFAIRTSCGTAASCCDMAAFQQSMVDDTVDQWQKRLEACIRAEGGHFEHLL